MSDKSKLLPDVNTYSETQTNSQFNTQFESNITSQPKSSDILIQVDPIDKSKYRIEIATYLKSSNKVDDATYIVNKLKELYTAIENPTIINEMIGYDMNGNTERNTFCRGIYTFMIKTISVFKIRNDLGCNTNINWKNMIESNKFAETRNITSMRLVLMLLILGISVPYPFWISLVPNLITSEGGTNYNNSNMIFKIFMTIINCVPILSFLTYICVVVKSSNKLLHKKIKIFNHSIKAHNDQFVRDQECYALDIVNVITFTLEDCELLCNLVCEMDSLQLLHCHKVEELREKIYDRWKLVYDNYHYMDICCVHSIWNMDRCIYI
jgi:hypothetical protein